MVVAVAKEEDVKWKGEGRDEARGSAVRMWVAVLMSAAVFWQQELCLMRMVYLTL